MTPQPGPDHEEECECKRCHTTVSLREGCEPTGYCDNCAQEIVADMELEARRTPEDQPAPQVKPWQTGIPPVPTGHMDSFICATRVHHASGPAINTRALQYGNRHVMPVSDNCPDPVESDSLKAVGDDGDYEWTGWFEFSCDNCETSFLFSGEVVAWMPMPFYDPATAPAAVPEEVERAVINVLKLLGHEEEYDAIISALAPYLATPAPQRSEDSELLDWAEAHDAMPEYDDNGFWKVRYRGCWYTGNTAREAIRAAIAKEGKA